MASSNTVKRLVTVIWGDCQTNSLWKRILKYSIACTIAIVIAILPRFKSWSMFLTPMVVVFAHPGQRMGLMVEALLMIIFGSLFGLSWSLLGLYLSSLVETSSAAAAYSIRALFLLVCVLIHGFIRSSSPRLFNFVLFLLVAALLTIQLPSSATSSLFTTFYLPVLLGGGVLIVSNLAIFPELSSNYLGTTTIETLSTTMDTMIRATHWFVTPGGDPLGLDSHLHPLRLTTTRKTESTVKRARWKMKKRVRQFFADFPNPFRASGSLVAFSTVPIHQTTLVQLAGQKSRLRSQLSSCKKAQDEVGFEISVSPLAPETMKAISSVYMTSLVQDVVTLIGACENKYLLVDDEDPPSTDTGDGTISIVPGQQVGIAQRTQPETSNEYQLSRQKTECGIAKPIREMEAGSYLLLEQILGRIHDPVQDFQVSMKEAVDLLVSCLAYCFDVSVLPSGSPTPKGIHLEEIDMRIDDFATSIAVLHRRAAEELKMAVLGDASEAVDFMPRMETFLVSSFLLALQGSADQVLEMLRHARKLVVKRQQRHEKSRIWIPQLRDMRKWLATGGETDAMVLPEGAKKAARRGLETMSRKDRNESLTDVDTPSTLKDEESLSPDASMGHCTAQPPRPKEACRKPKGKKNESSGRLERLRTAAADAIEWIKDSDDVDYALKLAIAVFLVTWPAFIASWDGWYSNVKGVWAPLQLILVFEVAIGTSLFVFAVRLFGVIFGCLIGYLSVEIGRGHRAAAVVILVVGIIPSVYVQVATKYVKAGMISIVSMAVVALAAVGNISIASEIYYKRLVAFLVGGIVAMIVEALIAPVRARDRLVESLSASVRQIQKMQAAVAVGVDSPCRPRFRSQKLFDRFNHCRDKAQAALGAAATFLPFCLTEPRLKGSFRPLAPIYKQIIHILQQIIDRMDNMIQLRRAYGSSILEDLNPLVYTLRRHVAASSTLVMFSVNEALTSWLPLPQFLPSARLAQLRLINKIRELLITRKGMKPSDTDGMFRRYGRSSIVTEETASMITQQKFLSWNATTAGQMEIIEYLEELIELVKLLVGVNAFRSGMLERPQYRQYIRQLETEQQGDPNRDNSEKRRYSGRQQQGNNELDLDNMDLDNAASDLRLRRAATVEQDAKKQPAVSDEEDEAGDDVRYTRMLQRVGARLRRNDRMVRRRAILAGDERDRLGP